MIVKYIEVTAPPTGGATPLPIAELLVGLVFPVMDIKVLGAHPAPAEIFTTDGSAFPAQSWDDAYQVGTKDFFDVLKKHRPEAEKWFREESILSNPRIMCYLVDKQHCKPVQGAP